MRVFSYVVKNDGGFAPNPFHGYCTLACCKPMIRRTAQVGDLVVGLSSRSERVVYAMKVDRVLSFDDYWAGSELAAKRPDWTSRHHQERIGDNIYEPLGAGRYRQLPSKHSNLDGTEDAAAMRKDLRGEHVLVATQFAYFGETGPKLAKELGFLRVARAHRSRFTRQQVTAVERWFANLEFGTVLRPAMWPAGEESWQASALPTRKPSDCAAVAVSPGSGVRCG